MSLNGLEDPAVKEAHEAALAEPGGWFLLKYASRDEVGLFGRGNGGIVETRNAIAQYEEASPLYGFLRYRRRSVIIKYLPDNCSRLVQARVTVHFTSLCDHFAPYDTTFTISVAKELKDTKLSAACSLHTASSSTSSSTSSLRRRRLMEIAEEEEEDQRASKRQSTLKEEDQPVSEVDGSASSPSQQPPVTLNSHLALSPDEAKFASATEPPPFLGLDRPPSPSKSLDARRLSAQLPRPDVYSSYSSYPYGKPKVKLGPRPSLDVGGRPRTSAGIGSYRPVSSIPAGFKLFSKGSKRGKDSSKVSPEAKENGMADNPAVNGMPPVPADLVDANHLHTSGERPVTSSGVSVKSTATAATSATKHNTMTPEKARLMKAMKLREKKKKLSAQPAPAVDSVEVPVASETLAHAEEHLNVDAAPVTNSDGPPDSIDITTPDANSADSAIDVGLSAADHASVETKTIDSHPASPVAMSSDIGSSTKASSLSESTDETGQTLHNPNDNVKAGEDVNENDSAYGHESAVDTFDVADTVKNEAELDNGQMDKTNGDKEQDEVPQLDVSQVAADADNHSVLEQDNAIQATRPRTPTSTTATQNPESSQLNHSPSSIIPTIEEPDPRASLSTINNEKNDAPTTDAKRARRRALIDPIRTDLGHGQDRGIARSDANLSDDEDLMDELQSATLQEAKPMTVSKSPVNPVFPHVSKQQPSPTRGAAAHDVRTVSNPIRGPLLTPGDVTASSARSVSSGAAFLHKIAQAPSNLAPKKSNIGSSISQRIKALEKLSNGTGPPVLDSPARLERPSSTFFSVRKTSGGLDPTASPSVVERSTSLVEDKTPSPPNSRESTPETSRLTARDRSGSMASRLSVFEGGNLPRGRPESIQVKARIIRDPAQPFPKLHDPRPDSSDFSPLDLKQSPLVVDHQRATPATFRPASSLLAQAAEPASRRESIQMRRMSREHRRSQSQDRSTIGDKDDMDEMRPRRRSSLSIVRDFIKEHRGSVMGGRSPSTDNLHFNGLASPGSLPTPAKSPSRPPSVHTTASLARRLSISSRRSSTSKDRDLNTATLSNPLSPSLMTETSGSGDESKSSTSELGHKTTGSGSKNRASRFMRRLSSSFGSGRKTATPMISPTVAEEEENFGHIPPSTSSSAAVQANTVSYLGDVNVQFPDNLLWKRRMMCLDSQGFLILSAVQGLTASLTGSERPAGAVKRYHLSDFRSPYIPEIEVQELPNSVCLDFVDGSGLQLACEDRAGQTHILKILHDAHENHASFGQ